MDGTRIRVYSTGPSDSGTIAKVFTHRGREEVWFGTSDGLTIVDPASGMARSVGRLRSKRIHCAVRGHDGARLVGTDFGLFVETESGFETVPIPGSSVASSVRAMVVAAAGEFTWLGTEEGLFRYSDREVRREPMPPGMDSRITALYVDRGDALWIGTGSSLLRYSAEGFRTVHAQSLERIRYVREFAENPEGTLWAATWDGLLEIRRPGGGGAEPTVRHRKSESLETIFLDRDANLWTSPERPSLSCEYSALLQVAAVACRQIFVTSEWVWFTSRIADDRYQLNRYWNGEFESWPLPGAATVLREVGGNLLIGTKEGLYQLEDGRCELHPDAQLRQGEILSLGEGADGATWVVSPVGLFRVVGGRAEDMRRRFDLLDERVMQVLPDWQGQVVVGTLAGIGFVRDGRAERHLTVDNGLRSNLVFTMLPARNGALWVGTNEGLQSFRAGKVDLEVEQSSALRSSVHFLAEDADGHIWAGTQAGVIRLNPRTQVIQTLLPEDGYGPGVAWSCMAHGTEVWITSDQGLFRYRKTARAPRLVVDRITTDRELLSVDDVTMTTDEPLLAIEFHTIQPGARNGSVLYRYRMRGSHEDWKTTRATQIEYEDLRAAEYVLELQACGRDLQLSEPVSIPVTVNVPVARYAVVSALVASLSALLILGVVLLGKTTREKLVLERRVEDSVKEKVELTEQLKHAQKLESLGTLAAGVAHDFNNSLQAISLNAELALLKAGAGGIQDHLRDISRAAAQATELTASLLTFGGKTSSRRTPQDLGELLDGCATMIRRTLPAAIEMVVDTSRIHGVWCKVDGSQLHQAIVNLCVNARGAMPNGGRLEISGTVERIQESDRARVSVVDDGHGISPLTVERVFDPFFTTKQRGKGTGLGLSIVHGIVSAHGGEVHINSRLGGGTSVELILPTCTRSDEDATADAVAEAAPRREDGLILIADDQNYVRSAIRKAFESSGRRVLEAADGAVALELALQNRNELDALVLDIDMPKIDGVTVMRRLREDGWSRRIVIITGYPTNVPPLDDNSRLVRKPFSIAAVLTAAMDPSH